MRSLYARRRATTTVAATGTSLRAGSFTIAALEQGTVVGFKCGERRIEHLAAWNDDDVDRRRGLVSAEQGPGQAFGAVAFDGIPQFAGGGNAESSGGSPILDDEQGHEAPVQFDACVVRPFELRATPDTLVPGKTFGHAGGSLATRSPAYSSETVRRFRPLARRRARTMRPFLVDIRTRKPWVFARRRVLGWYVRFPFMCSSTTLAKCR